MSARLLIGLLFGLAMLGLVLYGLSVMAGAAGPGS